VERSRSVTVIVASYNHAEFLYQRMQSIIDQTHQDLEVLVIDDCSTDNSREVLEQFKFDPRIKLVYSDINRGWVATSNMGVEESSSEFVIFANCDDFCDKEMISSLLEALKLNPTAAMSFCQSSLIDKDDALIGTDRIHRSRKFKQLTENDTLIDSVVATELLIESCIIPNLSAALFRRDVLVELGMLSSTYSVISDWDLFLKIASKYDIVYVHSILNSFRQHNATIRSSTKERKILYEYFELLLGQLQLPNRGKQMDRLVRTSITSKWISYLITSPVSATRNLRRDAWFFLGRDPKVFRYLPNAIFDIIRNRY
jgi:glycosyltransferase involved in cell wall biosynthesis